MKKTIFSKFKILFFISVFYLCFFPVAGGFVGASLLTWQLTGEVDQVGTPLQQFFGAGDSIEFIFTFETLTPDANPDNNRGNYENAIIDAYITVGTYSALIENNTINIYNDIGGNPDDSFGFGTPSSDTILSGDDLLGTDNRVYTFSGIRGSFQDNDADMFSSDSLPTSAALLNTQSEQKIFNVVWQTPIGGGSALMNGVSAINIQLQDITPAPVPVPEPSTMLFTSLGLLGMGAYLRKRRRK